MRENVLIQIKGIQYYDSENEVVELTTMGSFYKRRGVYYISYDESEATGFDGSRTTLKVEDSSRVTMQRSGASRSQLIIEKGTRHQCHYDTGYGAMIMGVSGNKIVSTLGDGGGSLNFKYTLDFNASMASQNEVFIDVHRPAPKAKADSAAKPAEQAPADEKSAQEKNAPAHRGVRVKPTRCHKKNDTPDA